ncbi:DUF2637 domain-containing protein [Micromonospora echinospora]|uniref:DUF2637 domain-containing protein n=1 Tax=Micromonospora echinospora TaxID=1877 RepID=UPI003788A289
MSTATEATAAPTRWARIAAALPITAALVLIAAVWAAGAVWSFEEQTAFAKDAGFHVPELLPLVLDGMAVAMAAVAYAASLDARPAVIARLGTALAVACSAASNVAWAWERSAGDEQTIALAGGVPVVANLAFEVLLSEIRRQVLRRRGQPGPAAITYPRLIRLALAPWPTFVTWRQLVLAATDPKRDFGQQPTTTGGVVDEDDPDIQACRRLEREMAAAAQSIAPRTARIALADYALSHWSAEADRPIQSPRPVAVTSAPERPGLPTRESATKAIEPARESTQSRADESTHEATEPRRESTQTASPKRTRPARTATRRTVTEKVREPAGESAQKTTTERLTEAWERLTEQGQVPSDQELADAASVSKATANRFKNRIQKED